MSETIAIERGFVDAHGAQLAYEAAGAGRPLVMLHGHLLDSGQWDGQFEEFARHYRVIRYDARGFGQSSMPAEPFAHHEDLHAVLQHFGIERALLIGCSGGGATIVDFALAYPDMTGALVLVGSGLSGYQWGDPLPKALALDEAFERGDIDQAVELSIQLWTDGASRAPEQVNPAAREHIRSMTARLFARPEVEATSRRLDPPAIGRLAELRPPILAIVGDQDVPPIQEMAGLVAAQAPQARRAVIADAGHHPNMEHPALFNQLVLDFLGALPD